MMVAYKLGFRIVGSVREPRRLVDWDVAFAAYSNCDTRAELEKEAFLSAFTFGADFRDRKDEWGNVNVKGFTGPCASKWVNWDVDREDDLDRALHDSRQLAAVIVERFSPPEGFLLVFFSGSKGFHLALSTALWSPEPSEIFNRVAKQFAAGVADAAGAAIDTGIYDKVRPFRAPNSRHPRTGLHKRRLSLDELQTLPLSEIQKLALEPAPFCLPTQTGMSEAATAEWLTAEQTVQSHAKQQVQRKVAATGVPTLNRLTLDFIRNGADEGDRHRRLFSAAANLAEFQCPRALAHALLTEAGLDAGLTPSDVRRQIECGLDTRGANDA